MVAARAIGASFAEAHLQAAVLGSVDFEGSDFERALLQGARFNNGRLSLSRFSASALWRATGARCQDAVISDPDFGVFIGFELIGGDTRANPARLVPIKPEPAAVDKFIEQASQFVPESAAGRLRTLLKDRLSAKDADTSAEQSEKGWTRCAEETAMTGDLQQRRADLYAIFSCEPGANSRYVAEGITRLRWRLLDATGAKLLARRLLELDGTPCPGAKDLSDSIKADLLETAGK